MSNMMEFMMSIVLILGMLVVALILLALIDPGNPLVKWSIDMMVVGR